jgi:hypothetical protein
VTRKPFLGLTLALAAGATSTAADPLAITTSGDLPFSHGELATALGARVGLADTTSVRRIEARITGDAQHVQIDVAGQTRTVALVNERGADAARLVAFAILDVAGAQLDPPDHAPSEPPPLEASAIAPPPPSATSEPWTFAMWGIGGTREFAALEIDAPIASRIRVVGSAGASLTATSSVMQRAVDVRSFPARLGAAVRFGAIELRAGAIATIEEASAARSSVDGLVGGGLGAVYVVPIARGFAVMAGGGGDAFANAVQYRVGGAPITTSDRIAWWIGAAVAREARW